MSRKRFLLAVVAIVLSVSLIVAEYIRTSPPVMSRLRIVAEDHQVPSLPQMGVMILCPSKARQMGLCNIDERQLHANYMVTVSDPPITRNLTVTCKVILVPEPEPARAMEIRKITPVDKSGLFTCAHTRIGEDRLEVDLAFIGDPDDVALMAHYLLLVTVTYDESLLPWMPLLTRRVSGTDLGDLCLLGYDMGKHPAPGTRESENPLGEFPSCEPALFWQRQMLGLEPPCETTACQWVGAGADMLSHVTVHVVDAYGKPIQNVTVWLNTTFCCWIDGTLGGAAQNFSETSDSDGNATFVWVIPYARYTVMIGGVVLSEVTGPPPTVSTTITVILA